MIRASFSALALTTALTLVVVAQTTTTPKIWRDAALEDWATPVATLNIRPAHIMEAEYYAVPGDNLRTYPVYHPDAEPPNYWDELKNKKPELLVDVSTIRSREDWIAAGARAFREPDSFWSRSSDPAAIAQARDPKSFTNTLKLPDGSALGPRWVVTDQGVMLSWLACANCHLSNRRDGTLGIAGPRGPRPPDSPGLNPRVPGAQGSRPVLQRYFVGDSVPTLVSRMFLTPWAPDDRLQVAQNTAPGELRLLPTATLEYSTVHMAVRSMRRRSRICRTSITAATWTPPEPIGSAGPKTWRGTPRSSLERIRWSSGHIGFCPTNNARFVSATPMKCCSRLACTSCRWNRRKTPTSRHPTCARAANACSSVKAARPATCRRTTRTAS
jgi:hypothetical protein